MSMSELYRRCSGNSSPGSDIAACEPPAFVHDKELAAMMPARSIEFLRSSGDLSSSGERGLQSLSEKAASLGADLACVPASLLTS